MFSPSQIAASKTAMKLFGCADDHDSESRNPRSKTTRFLSAVAALRKLISFMR
jgi:hypothetical protein